MIELVPPEESPFEMKACKSVIDARHHLGHSVVVSVLGFESELKICAPYSCRPARQGPSNSAISPNLAEVWVPIRNEAKRHIIAQQGRLRRAVDSPHKLVVQERRTKRELALLQAEKAIMVPWRLAKHRKGKWVPMEQLTICFFGPLQIAAKFRLK